MNEPALLAAFRRAARGAPAYRTLLEEHGVRAEQIVDAESFSRLCPITNKANTFSRFPIDQLCVAGGMRDLGSVLTSSGHGGRFSFGLISRPHAEGSADFIDRALDDAFQIRSRATLAINCLPMGVGFSSRLMTVATTSVREDMALALVNAFGAHYDQILLVGDPLFLKLLTDRALDDHCDWRRHRINVVVGEEIFGENYRDYLADCLGLDPDRPDGGYIMSSFGVGELGLHLCHETPATIAVRRAARRVRDVAREVLGLIDVAEPVPMILTFNPDRTRIEIAEPDEHGYGRMTISMLDDELPLPLLRYQTGDEARMLDAREVGNALGRRGIRLPAELPAPLLALKGRDRESLPNGSHVSVYKEALYADRTSARLLSGACRLVFTGTSCTMHVQLRRGQAPVPGLEQVMRRAVDERARPARVVVWSHPEFPFGMSLDYERKFAHFVSGESVP